MLLLAAMLPLAGIHAGSVLVVELNGGSTERFALQDKQNNKEMKKLLFALMAFVFTTSHAQEIMKVVMSDGTTNSFEVKKIQKVVFEGQEIVMTTGEVTNITTNSAQFSFSVSGISKVISTGVLVSTSNNLTYDNFQTGKKKSTQEDGTYSVSIDGLSSSTTYYYRAFAKVGEGLRVWCSTFL